MQGVQDLLPHFPRPLRQRQRSSRLQQRLVSAQTHASNRSIVDVGRSSVRHFARQYRLYRASKVFDDELLRRRRDGCRLEGDTAEQAGLQDLHCFVCATLDRDPQEAHGKARRTTISSANKRVDGEEQIEQPDALAALVKPVDLDISRCLV